MPHRTYDVAVLAGGGSGSEVTPAVVRCIDILAERHDLSVAWANIAWGSVHDHRHGRHGRMMLGDALDTLADRDAISLGAGGRSADT